MALTPGTRLGAYEIIAAIGAGGMGEVYKARDTRLDRIVAIKILSDALAADPQFRERFDREARAISHLAHPHICALHDVGEHHGTAFLVLEYLEGETLANRLKKGALPLEHVLKFAIEIAGALDTAHGAGITHRDLKPGNIMLTKTGAKLLDFGLAKTQEGVVAGAGLSMLPTTPPTLTALGAILGTFQYMAPEQLEGKNADARSDIFAFGALVYEMATGQKAFQGKTSASLISSIMSADSTPLLMVRPGLPRALDHVVGRCLSKDPETRWQSVRDVATELRWITESIGEETGNGRPKLGSRRARASWLSAIAVGCVVSAGLTWLALRDRVSPVHNVIRASIALNQTAPLANRVQRSLDISPDGRHIVYSAATGSSTQLFLRSLNRSDATPIAGTEGGFQPFLSSDSQSVGFIGIDKKMKRVALSGGAPVALCDIAGVPNGASWGDDGNIVYVPGAIDGLWQVSDRGGTPHRLTSVNAERGEKGHRSPFVLPGGKAVIFVVGSADTSLWDDARIELLVVATGERRVLIEGGYFPRYVPTGHILYARAGSLLAVPFDLGKMTVTGSPVTVIDRGFFDAENGYGHLTLSGNGTLVYVTSPVPPRGRKLVWVDRLRQETTAFEAPRSVLGFRLAPEGQRVALTLDGATLEVWVYDLSRQTMSRFAWGWDNTSPIWTRDGGRVTFRSTRASGQNELFWSPADGSAPPEKLTTSGIVPAQAGGSRQPRSWSPDGKWLLFNEFNPRTQFDVYMMGLGGDRKAQPLLHDPFNESDADVSPDGRWLAYSSDESGRSQVYVRSFPTLQGKWQISTDGGVLPRWNPNGHELLFRNGTKVMTTEVSTSPSFAPKTPAVLLDGQYPNMNFDVSPDGNRFLMLKQDETPPISQLAVVFGWFEELKARVPTR